MTLVRALDDARGLRVLVLGEAMLDRYVSGRSTRLCPEGPVPVVDVDTVEDVAGGAANVAANLAALGARPTLVTVVGDDADGRTLRALVAATGTRTDRIVLAADRRTLRKERLLGGGQLLLRVDRGSTGPLRGRDLADLRSALAAELPRHDAIVVSDYGYGAIPTAIHGSLADRGGRLLVVDAKEPPEYAELVPDAVKPNYRQAAALLGLPAIHGPDRTAQLEERGGDLLARTGASLVAVTLDADGAIAFEPGSPAYRSYTRPAPDARASGAGDTFVAALTLAIAAGLDGPRATDLAAAAAAVAVSGSGTTVCSRAALDHWFAADRCAVMDAGRAAEAVAAERARGRRIVFANGCFDILHPGHIATLDRAKALGDVLVVAVNDDEGVRRRKGDGRPVNRLEDRMEVLAALSCVDLVVPFGEDTPVALLERLRPDVVVKGGDYRADDLPEAEVVRAYGGEMAIVPIVEDRSTTGIIERIRHADARADASA